MFVLSIAFVTWNKGSIYIWLRFVFAFAYITSTCIIFFFPFTHVEGVVGGGGEENCWDFVIQIAQPQSQKQQVNAYGGVISPFCERPWTFKYLGLEAK